MSRRNSRLIDSQLQQIDSIFHANEEPHVVKFLDIKKDENCDVHRASSPYRANNDAKRRSITPDKYEKPQFRNSIGSFTELVNRYKESNRGSVDYSDANNGLSKRRSSMPFVNGNSGIKSKNPLDTKNSRLFKGMEHPSNFPNILRSTQKTEKVCPHNNGSRRSLSNSQNNVSQLSTLKISQRPSLPRDYTYADVSIPSSPEPKKEIHSILKHKNENDKKVATSNDDLKEIIKRLSFDYIEKEMSQNEKKVDNDVLSSDSSNGCNGRFSTKSAPRRTSIDSLDSNSRRSSRRFSDFSANSDDYIMFKSPQKSLHQVQSNDANRPKFLAVTSLEDLQAVRCAEFHPNGSVYAVGSNSKTFRICEYPSLFKIRDDHQTFQASVLFKRTKHHKGSIYCMAWSPDGSLIATGSNDKTVKLMRYNDDQKQLEGREIELTMHDGTVRDLCFLEDSTNKSSLLISGGAGDCKIYITDCATSTPYQALSGHGSPILCLYNWGGAMFVSGSQDKTVRFWDLRTRGCVNVVTPLVTPNSRQGSPVAAVCVDPSGRLLVSGHEDSSCVLYDIRGNRAIQCFRPHSSDIRSIRFSPSAYYLLSASYDNKLVLTDLQGDLTMPLPSVVVAQHSDKVISGRWHPSEFSFLSTSADKTAKLWALPPV